MIDLVNKVRLALATGFTSNDELSDLVADDPNDDEGVQPAIFQANMNEITPVYPCITYRIGLVQPDMRFRPPLSYSGTDDVPPDENYYPRIVDFYIDIEAWDDEPNSDRLDLIAATIERWLENRYFEFSGGRVFRSEVVFYRPDNWDKDLNARFHLMRYRMRVKRDEIT